ncbi:tRNA lysidine(34) synthetase TilS [candidate division TA06 bacterium]|uniref:tRNA(Ile)-lysidine synthase n=1 Tax=candidate division TA06 bacterium TaxID=2250710 RepID=A0A933ICS2_UNCT6|nr:tRNA lysidine(34) synthetase TilS [candidate division TA06 bacterium]
MKQKENLRSQVKEFIVSRKLIGPGDRVLAAFSGGPDSLGLLYLLQELSPELKFKLTACHVNHNLRGKAAKADAVWAGKLAQSWGIKLITKNVDAKKHSRKNKLSLETSARELRRTALLETARIHQCDLIATGHNLDDQAETVLMRLIRGSGLNGLSGIPLRNGPFIRPLLSCSRSSIDAYLKQHKLAGRKDASNRSQKFFRNRVRHQLLPLLETYNPQIKKALSQLAGNVEHDLEIITEQVQKAFNSCTKRDKSKIAIDLSKFKLYNKGLQHNILRHCSELLLGRGAVPDLLHITRAIELMLKGRTGAKVNLTGDIWIEKTYGRAALSTKKTPPLQPPPQRVKRGAAVAAKAENKDQMPALKTLALAIPGTTKAGKYSIRAWLAEKRDIANIAKCPPELAYFDEAVLEGSPLMITARKDGDRMIPFGHRSPKKIKDIFIAAKIPQSERSGWPLVKSGKTVVWLCGVRRSDDFFVIAKTKKVLCLEFIKNRKPTKC